ncbi:MAG: Gldg family protein [Pseudomonadota bacterium]
MTERSLSKTLQITLAIALAVVLFLAVNIFSNNTFRTARADLTDTGLYSLSQSTRELLQNLKEPIHMRLFLSKSLVQSAPQLSAYANRVQSLLATYRNLSNGRITLEVIDPAPFSDDEDRAVAFGINRLRATGGPEVFFGLAATNSTDGRGQIPVFSPDREAFLEYDITRLVAELGQPKKPVIALIDGIGMAGNPMSRVPEQQILKQLRELFTIEPLRGDVDALPEGTRVVLMVHPKTLTERTLYTLDQWVLGGGATIVMVDPYAENQPGLRPGMPPSNPASNLDKLFKAWGVQYSTDEAVGDPGFAIRTARDVGGRPTPVTTLPWLAVTRGGMAEDDAIFAQLTSIVMTTPGHLSIADGKADVSLSPLLTTSIQAGTLPAKLAGNPQTDPRQLAAELKRANGPMTLAARLQGKLATAYPKGKPSGSEAAGAPLKESTAKPNVILIADADMVMDRNWIRQRQVLGQTFADAFASNGAFVLNAIEQMAGGVALADLRGRGVSWRPFERIEALEKSAEQRYLKKQQELQKKLTETEGRLRQLSAADSNGSAAVSEETVQAVDQFRGELLATRAELRNVQFNLNRDVDRLKTWLTATNVAIVPAIAAAIALAFAFAKPRQPVPSIPPERRPAARREEDDQ